MDEQRIVIPEYITKVKVSDKRRATYYLKDGPIPVKYKKNIDKYIFKTKRFTNYSKSLLFDTETKKFVVKNKTFVGKPRHISIRGNMLYAGMHESVRMLVMSGIKDNFRQYVATLLKPIHEFPIHINAEVHTTPGLRNWDVDNLWIYIKAFQDLLIEYRIIPDDSVRYITKAPGFEFFPVPVTEDRKMVFVLSPDKRDVIHHTMFAYKHIPMLKVKGQFKALDTVIYISVEDRDSGDTDLQPVGIHFKACIGIGKKKLIYDEFVKALISVRYWAIQHDALVVIDHNIATEYPNYDRDKVEMLIDKYLCREGIKVVIHNLN
jgi:hypothetical protein